MKKILLIQFRTDISLAHEEKCVRGLIGKNRLEVINLLDENAKIPSALDLKNYSAVITGGSGQFNVTDWPDDEREKIEKIKPFLGKIIERDFPLLSICFGHQLLALWFGGIVRSDKSQAESGTFEVRLNNDGVGDKLFKSIPQNFYAVLGHKDTVTKLPEGAKLLGRSDRCSIEAYKIKNNIYSVQFHPELDLDSIIFRLSLYPSYRTKATSEMVKNFHSIPHASKVLLNFIEEVAI